MLVVELSSHPRHNTRSAGLKGSASELEKSPGGDEPAAAVVAAAAALDDRVDGLEAWRQLITADNHARGCA
jgi:hypothetical protein